MSNETRLKTRIINKHDIEANWLRAVNFTPVAGEIIVYDIEVDAEGNNLELPEGRTVPYSYERFKIGDGVSKVNDLPFTSHSGIVLSEGAIAEQGCFAGLKGYTFYYGTQSTGIAPGKAGYKGPGDYETDFSSATELIIYSNSVVKYPSLVNKKLSIINGSKYINCCTVTSALWNNAASKFVIHATIDQSLKGAWTWNNFVKEPRPENGVDECTFFCLDYPEIGDIDLGANSRASGRNTKALAIGAFAAGRDNIAQSQYATALGRDTRANYAALAINRKAEALGDNSFAGGNTSKALHNTSFAWGTNVQTSAAYQHVIGQMNADDPAARFIVGIGNNSRGKLNGFVVDTNGNGRFHGKATVGSDPVDSMDVTTKRWVENNTANKAWVTDNFVSPSYVESYVKTNTDKYIDATELTKEFNTQLKPYIKNNNTTATNITLATSKAIIGSSSTSTASNSFILGPNNSIDIEKVTLPGQTKPTIYADNAIAIGRENTVSSQYSIALGYGLKSATPKTEADEQGVVTKITSQNRNQVILGYYNEVLEARTSGNQKDGALLVVGNGLSDAKRSNAFIIWGDGRATVSSEPQDSMDVTTKQYVDTAIANADVDLSDYYTKKETYNKTEVDDAIAAIDIPETDLTDYATKNYVDNIKNDLLNGAGSAYDTLKELGDLIDENTDAIEALETIASGKADAVHNHDDLYNTKSEIDAKIAALNTALTNYLAESKVYSDTNLNTAKSYTDTAVSQKSQVQIITWEDND